MLNVTDRRACFQGRKIYTFEIHLFPFQGISETNIIIFSNNTGEKFNLTKTFYNVKVQL